jgi:uncharacterized protein (TIGR02246 family)
MFQAGYRGVGYFLLLTLLFAAGCQQAPAPAPDTRAADEAAIRTADADMAKAVGALDAVKAASFYLDNVIGISPDAATIQGKENMLKYFETWLVEKPEFAYETTRVEVARSGDLAYSWGTGSIKTKDKKGNVTETTIRGVSVWKKQPDGIWKIALDTMIPDPPAKKK